MMAVVTAVLVQKETGGNLAEIFDQISRVIRSRFRFGRKVRTLSAEGRLSAWILTLMPIVLFAVIWVDDADLPAGAARQPDRPEAAHVRRRHGDARVRVDAQDHPHRGVAT